MVNFILPHDKARDAFGRLRTAQPVTLFDSKLLYDKAPLFWDEVEVDNSGGAASTHVANDALVTMTVNGGDSITRQTKRRFNYQPGKSQVVLQTGILTSGGTGVTGRIGAFDANDGFFFEVDGTTVSVGLRKNTSDTTVAQSSWNIDPMDGTGPSGITANWDRAQIFFVDFEWLGVGKVRYGLYLNGVPNYVHEITHINELTGAYISTPNLPLRYEIASAGGGDSATMKHICSSVISEGGSDRLGVTRAITTAGTHVNADTADSIYAIIGVRLKSTHLDSTVFAEKVTLMCETADDFEWMLLVNPTVAGTFTYNDVTNSPIQYATGATANTITAGQWDIILDAGLQSSTQKAGGSVQSTTPTVWALGSTIAGVSDTVVLAARPLSADADIHGVMQVRELV